MNILDDIATKVVGAIGLVLATIFGGLHIRRKNSAVAAANAQDSAIASKAAAEADYFATAIEAVTKSRDNWQQLHAADTQRLRDLLERERQEHAQSLLVERKIATDLRDQKIALDAELRHTKSAYGFRLRLMQALHPDIDFSPLDSGHAPLGSPETKP